jgi:hypothetical protein
MTKNLPFFIPTSLVMKFLQPCKIFIPILNFFRAGSPDLKMDGIDGVAFPVLQGHMVPARLRAPRGGFPCRRQEPAVEDPINIIMRGLQEKENFSAMPEEYQGPERLPYRREGKD